LQSSIIKNGIAKFIPNKPKTDILSVYRDRDKSFLIMIIIIRVHLSMALCMEPENLNGLMVSHMKDPFKIIVSQERVNIPGQMEAFMRVCYYMEKGMERVSTIILKTNHDTADNGKTASEMDTAI
jgi:hypothetical protein